MTLILSIILSALSPPPTPHNAEFVLRIAAKSWLLEMMRPWWQRRQWPDTRIKWTPKGK